MVGFFGNSSLPIMLKGVSDDKRSYKCAWLYKCTNMHVLVSQDEMDLRSDNSKTYGLRINNRRLVKPTANRRFYALPGSTR